MLCTNRNNAETKNTVSITATWERIEKGVYNFATRQSLNDFARKDCEWQRNVLAGCADVFDGRQIGQPLLDQFSDARGRLIGERQPFGFQNQAGDGRGVLAE